MPITTTIITAAHGSTPYFSSTFNSRRRQLRRHQHIVLQNQPSTYSVCSVLLFQCAVSICLSLSLQFYFLFLSLRSNHCQTLSAFSAFSSTSTLKVTFSFCCSVSPPSLTLTPRHQSPCLPLRLCSIFFFIFFFIAVCLPHVHFTSRLYHHSTVVCSFA